MKKLLLPMLALTLVGAGCVSVELSKSPGIENAGIDSRLAAAARYIVERDDCTDANWDRGTSNSDEVEQANAEYECSTYELAKQYFSQDQKGITDLCVLTQHVSGWTQEDGFLADETPESLANLQEYDSFTGVYFDDNGDVVVLDDQIERWRGACTFAIASALYIHDEITEAGYDALLEEARQIRDSVPAE